MLQFIGRTAPWSAALFAFLGGAAAGAGVIPVVLYSASEDLTAVLVVLCGLAATPFGGLVGLGVRARFGVAPPTPPPR